MCARAIVTGLSTLCHPGLDKDSGSGGGAEFQGLGPQTRSLPGPPGAGEGPVILAQDRRSCRTMERGGHGRRWGSSLPLFP